MRLPRPLRRRAETMARPARVRIRRRKPWTRARRRLFGWNVRLPLATVNTPRIGGHPAVPEAFGDSLDVGSARRPGRWSAQDSHHAEGDCTRVLIQFYRVKLAPPGAIRTTSSFIAFSSAVAIVTHPRDAPAARPQVGIPGAGSGQRARAAAVPGDCPHLWIIVWKYPVNGIFVGPTVPRRSRKRGFPGRAPGAASVGCDRPR